MTITVAFILEAFLFRTKYREEHPTDEEGKWTLLMQVQTITNPRNMIRLAIAIKTFLTKACVTA